MNYYKIYISIYLKIYFQTTVPDIDIIIGLPKHPISGFIEQKKYFVIKEAFGWYYSSIFFKK